MIAKHLNVMESGLTVIQQEAICFAAGVIGALAVVLFSRVLFVGIITALAARAIIGKKP